MTLTGRRVALMFVGGFAVIIAANLTLAVNAVRTFPGLEVGNSYVASQSFNARRAAQEALGWRVDVKYADGLLTVHISDREGRPAPARDIAVHAGRPTAAKQGSPLAPDSGGGIPIDLGPGLWRVDISATAPDGTTYAHRLILEVPA